ncbi:MAG: TfoX/Sxy family protein [Beijerinckiaceae bacterium]|jgi:DNA transformation protein|nr:TfoX/Sxy family protein [Beijerinckiaceae bacterium]
MAPEDLEDFFAPFLRISLKRMFGGHGITAEGRMIALAFDGEIFLKVDDATRGFFESQGATPFTYEKKTGEQAVMSYYRVPAEAFDDDQLKRACLEAALEAARRAALPKPKKTPKSKKPAGKPRTI